MEYQSERLFYSKGRVDDADKMFDNFYSEEKTAKFLLWKPFTDRGACARYVAGSIEYAKTHDYFFIYEKASGEPIGYLSAEEHENGVWKNVAICFGTRFVSKGYGTEAMTFLLDYIKSKDGKEVEYTLFEGNTASQKLAEKLGFSYVETRPRYVKKADTTKNERVYRLEL